MSLENRENESCFFRRHAGHRVVQIIFFCSNGARFQGQLYSFQNAFTYFLIQRSISIFPIKKVLTYLRRETITLPDISILIRRMNDEEFIR